jgi:hypothetical protein
MWLCSTFSNEPALLSHYSGYIEALEDTGLITAFGIDSNHISFLIEQIFYFSLSVVGLLLCVLSAVLYIKGTKYGDEQCVIVPKAFQLNESSANQDFAAHTLEIVIIKE